MGTHCSFSEDPDEPSEEPFICIKQNGMITKNTVFLYQGEVRRFKEFCRGKGITDYTSATGKVYADDTGNDTIMYAASFPCNIPGVTAGALSIGLNDIQGFMTCINGLKGDKLDLILHSPGGSLEAAEQLAQYLRDKYSYIRAIIPQNAMSAATMIACACDEIVMGCESAIGPIDPQMTMTRPNGVVYTLPAHSILADFETAKKEISADPKAAQVWVPKLLEIPNGFLDLCKKTIELSISKVEEWLDTYMFKEEEEKKEKK